MLLPFLVVACASGGGPGRGGVGGDDATLDSLLASDPTLAAVAAEAERHRLQVVIGEVVAGDDGPRLVQHGFRLGAEYFYPASTVKLFAAVAAVELLAELRRTTGLPIDLDTPLVFHPLFADDVREESDPTHRGGGRITVGHEIRKLFLVSDNEAFNRLYELVGQECLAKSLERAGLDGGRIVHRLSEWRSEADNRRYPRIDLVTPAGVHTLPERQTAPLAPPPPIPGLRVGEGYLDDGVLVDRPMDFATKNLLPLAELQRGLCKVVRPDVDCGGPGFDLGARERDFLVIAMGQLPRESSDPLYPEVPDEHVKFVLPGVRRVLPSASVFDKSGQAYGFTIENAWIVDPTTGRGVFLAATLYTNADGILNDDEYEYESVALPFLGALGEAVARRFLVGQER